jgi:hypothetical protein
MTQVEALYARWRCIFGETDTRVNELGDALKRDAAAHAPTEKPPDAIARNSDCSKPA